MICLDTNVVIGAINGRVPSIRQRLSANLMRRQIVGVPSVVLFEIRYFVNKFRLMMILRR